MGYKDDLAALGVKLEEKRLGYHLTNNSNKLMPGGVKYITIHQTDNVSFGADAEAHHAYQANNSSGVDASWHYTVDEKQVIQSFRDDRITWHAANSEGNNSSIGIEMCVDADIKGGAMMGKVNYQKTVDNAAKLVAVKLKQHGLTVEKVKQHHDWSGKNCPSYVRAGKYGITWSYFLSLVKTYYSLITKPASEESQASKPVAQDPVNGPYYDEDQGRLWFRAIAGSFETREEAIKAIENLKKDYPNAWLQATYVKETK